jgi:(4S)-4-hydroxy-5-phosphonooxypentane-2,3-dione isomerase
MSKVSLVARIEAKDGKADELITAFGALFAEVAKEPGTIEYVLHRSSTDPNILYVTEVYEDQAALDAHMGSDHFKSFGGSLGDLVNGADLQFLTPVLAAKGLDI